MKNKISKSAMIYAIMSIFVFTIIFPIFDVRASNHGIYDDFYMTGGGTVQGGVKIESQYFFNYVGHSNIKNEVYYEVTSGYVLYGDAEIHGDRLKINGKDVGDFISNNGWHYDVDWVGRTEKIPVTLHGGYNTMETVNIGGIGGDSSDQIIIEEFATAPEVLKTDGIWYEGEVATGIRTWQSLYTDGAAGSVEGNKVQTATGFMYKDVDEQPTEVNAYSNTVIGRNSNIPEIKDAYSGILLPLQIETLNRAGAYWVKSEY